MDIILTSNPQRITPGNINPNAIVFPNCSKVEVFIETLDTNMNEITFNAEGEVVADSAKYGGGKLISLEVTSGKVNFTMMNADDGFNITVVRSKRKKHVMPVCGCSGQDGPFLKL